VITGLDYQLPGFVAGTIDVDVVEVDVVKLGKHIIRKALVAEVCGQKQPQAPYPTNMIALVALNANQPLKGRYSAEITKSSDCAWRCVLAA
jgi:hypothetical protein